MPPHLYEINMKSETVLMTPAFADSLLKNNTINRKIRPTWVEDLTAIINRGEWLTTHQGIAISTKNNVLDGQHRLIAISKSGKPVEVMLFTDCQEETFIAIDRGVLRSVSDVTKYSKKTSEVLIAFHKFAYASRKPSPQQVIAVYKKIGLEVDHIHAYAPSSKKSFTSTGVRCAVAMLFKKGCEDSLDIYRKLSLSEFDGLSTVMQSFVKQAIENRLAPTSLALGGAATQFHIFTKALFCFDKRNKDRKVFSVDEAMKQDAKRLIIEVLS